MSMVSHSVMRLEALMAFWMDERTDELKAILMVYYLVRVLEKLMGLHLVVLKATSMVALTVTK